MKKNICITLLSLWLFAPSAHAGLLYQVLSVSSPSGEESNNPLVNLINQSGLSANYVSGVTDFASFVSSTTAGFFTPSQASALGGALSNTAVFNFDLGITAHIGGMAIWNQAGGASLQTFDVFGSLDGNLFTQLSSGTLPAPSSTVAEPAHVFSWASRDVQYIRLVTTDNFGFNAATRFNEIAFNAVSPIRVSAPAPVVFFSLVLIGLMMAPKTQHRRDRRAKPALG